MLKEFKDFINKGNLIDFAVGVVMGAAFTTVTTAFMEKIVNPLLGRLVSVDFGSFGLSLGMDKDNKPITLAYGGFISAVLNFIITALVMFLVVKAYNKAKPAPVAAPAGPTDVELLAEIRDLLKK
jgi:large conductance mechanosensitive channel